MGWFTGSSSRHYSSSRPGYARSYAGSSYSGTSRHHHSSTSRYRRSPRDGYLQYLWYRFKVLWRDLLHYARRHPYKVFFMVIMPLVSGGVLHNIARQFGVNLPEMGGSGARGGYSRGGYYGSEGYGGRDDYYYGSSRGGDSGMNLQNVASGIGGLASLAKMAHSFM